jgi:hypothetical protein
MLAREDRLAFLRTQFERVIAIKGVAAKQLITVRWASRFVKVMRIARKFRNTTISRGKLHRAVRTVQDRYDGFWDG